MAIVNGLNNLADYINDDLTILTDSQAVIHALDDVTTTSKTVKMVKHSLNTLGTRVHIRIKWIKAHVGHYGNEIADQLAKTGSKCPPHGPEPFLPLPHCTLRCAIQERTTEIWSKRWKDRSDARQTAILFPEIALKKSAKLLQLSKEALGKAVRALSGHDFRSRHNAVLEKQVPPPCSLCKQMEESPSHLILHCPKLIYFRAQTFGSYTQNIVQSWTAHQVVTFVSDPLISETET